MGVPTFDRVMGNLEYLATVHERSKGRHRPEVEINTCATPETLAERDEAERRWHSLGFKTHLIRLDNRAASVAGAEAYRGHRYYEYCRRPFHSMVICWDGVVPLCCADYRRACAVGDVSRETIHAVWNGTQMNAARLEMTNGEFRTAEICRSCEMADDGG